MDEHSLRTALNDVMTATPTPPAMDGDRVLATARQARRAHRARLAGAGSAVAVVIVAAGAFTLPVFGGGVDDSIAVGSASTSTSSASSTVTITPTAPSDTKPVLPPGQTDRTQTSGPEADRSQSLLKQLLTVAPAGYVMPEKVANPENVPAQDHQAQVTDDEGKVWEYAAYAAIGKDDRWGRLTVRSVHFEQGARGCDIPWEGLAASCATIEVGGKFIPVYTAVSSPDQWAVYMHPDGIVVTVLQQRDHFSSLNGLTAFPLTPEKLAELAADPRFTLR
ncbi:hypothetical protein [Actinokineospora diospyrosa]|uniref:Uncharacterized protein n=1 Tax=Actinokineospora diospyrosa TaxID=103728 RepID=A0ABT1IHW4_9PSEU|nr:hypothetical protein [Actinokineospora diospyrosa]MCP2272237.1 hypothetical protein [Actinokineospora diospyrosa]